MGRPNKTAAVKRSRLLARARAAERASDPFSPSPCGAGDDDDDVPQMSLTLTNDALHKVGNGRHAAPRIAAGYCGA